MNMKDVKAITIPECIVANNSQTFSSTSNTGSNAWFNYYPTSTTALGSCKTIRIKGKFHVYGNSYSWLGVWYNSDASGGTSQITLNTGSGWVETPFDITCYLVNDDWINNTLWNVFAFGGGSSNYRWIRAVVAKNNNNNLDFYTQSDTTNEYFRVTVDSIEIGVKEIKDSNNVVIWKEKSSGPVTISYRGSITNGAGTLPESKTVPAGYALTAADLPSGGTTWTIDGWTIDGENKVSVGYVVNEDITLCAVHKRTYTTSSSLFKSAKNHQYDRAFTLTIDGGNVGNSTSSGTTKTYSLSKTYNATKPSYDYYRVAQLGGWGGLVFSEVTSNPCRIEWTPSRSSVTFNSSMSGGTNAYNYGSTYPTLVVRNNSSGSFIYSKTQNNTNKITYETVSGAIFYIQHGGNDGGQKYASRADYKQQGDTPSSSSYGITCDAAKATETVYVYTLPPVS